MCPMQVINETYAFVCLDEKYSFELVLYKKTPVGTAMIAVIMTLARPSLGATTRFLTEENARDNILFDMFYIKPGMYSFTQQSIVNT